MDDRGFRGDAGSKAKSGRNRRDRGLRDSRDRRPRPSQAKPVVEQFLPATPQMKTPIILTKTANGKVSIRVLYFNSYLSLSLDNTALIPKLDCLIHWEMHFLN